MRKYQQLCYEIRERRDGYKVKIIPVVIGCLGGGMKRLKDDVKELFKNEKDFQWICREMQKTVLWENLGETNTPTMNETGSNGNGNANESSESTEERRNDEISDQFSVIAGKMRSNACSEEQVVILQLLVD